jgi:dTDP-4-dehydrorhamnose reductase
MKKVLILGKTGMLGHVVYEYLKSSGNFEVVGASRKKDDDIQVDVLGNHKILESEEIRSFDYIINCIGTLIKESQQYPARAILINSWFPHYLEDCLKNSSTKILHIGTDCVFSGKTGFYKETAIPDETNFYGRSKALGEIVNGKDLTIRTSIIGPELKYGDGLFHWFMNQQPENKVSGYVNAFWNGVTTLELAKVIERLLIKNDLTGLYHAVPKNAISKYSLLDIINKVFGKGIEIIPTRLPKAVNKVLIDSRNQLGFVFSSYEEQIEHLKKWILNHDFENYSTYK